MGFYDDFADDYDAVTDRQGSAAGVEAFCEALRQRVETGRVLDVACGTGRFAFPLARRGSAVAGVDVSVGLLDQARARARAEALEVTFAEAPMQRLGEAVPGPFDVVLCMGNSIPHLLDEGDLQAALGGFAERLGPGGAVAVHLLNYGPILARRERVVGVTEQDGSQYVRFYDFLDSHRMTGEMRGTREYPPPAPDGRSPVTRSESQSHFRGSGLLRFNLLELHWREGECRHRLVGTELRPWLVEELAGAMRQAGLGRVEVFGGLDFRAFQPEHSDVALLLARLGGGHA